MDTTAQQQRRHQRLDEIPTKELEGILASTIEAYGEWPDSVAIMRRELSRRTAQSVAAAANCPQPGKVPA
jgi:hypothetical protein